MFLKCLELVSNALDGLIQAFIKSRKPVRYVTLDIDVLINVVSVRDVYLRLKAAGFRAKVGEKHMPTVTKGDIIVGI